MNDRSLFLLCGHTMKEIKLVNDTSLITEVLDSMVCEKSEIVWIVPFCAELQEQIIDDIFSRYPVSNN